VLVFEEAPLLSLLSSRQLRVRVFATAGLAAITMSVAASSGDAPFMAENQIAMERMMQGMAVKPSGDADRDFIALMIPHHQGAIDMARAELRYGRNEQLHRIAQEIIIDQEQEIAAMRLAAGQPDSSTSHDPARDK
jgi:uncharacterized protein (DUF305 family)